jgi:hypothetical protein
MALSGATAAQLLPLSRDDATAGRRRHGARSDDAVIVGDLLVRHVPALASGELEIVAIARRAGVLTKVAVRRRLKLLGPAGGRCRWWWASAASTSAPCAASWAANY